MDNNGFPQSVLALRLKHTTAFTLIKPSTIAYVLERLRKVMRSGQVPRQTDSWVMQRFNRLIHMEGVTTKFIDLLPVLAVTVVCWVAVHVLPNKTCLIHLLNQTQTD